MTNQYLFSYLLFFSKERETMRPHLKKIHLSLLIGVFFIFLGNLQAQNKTISGVVTDGSSIGGPLPGVTILVKGTLTGTSTDFDGKYSIDVPNGNATLVFSYVGYKKQEIAINNKTTINVTMAEDVSQLDAIEIVAIGYGSVKRENLTGSVASISAKELSKLPVSNISEALSGRLPGVRIQSLDGAPGSDIIVRVRGGGSITLDNAPLYVVDGFIVDNLNDIPPGDIQTVDVLKDAATTAIYGSRAANGVILVTTKNAKAGKTTVNINSYVQINTFPTERKYKVLSPYEFAQLHYEAAILSSQQDLDAFTYHFGYFDDLELYKYSKPIDEQDILFGSAVTSRYRNISIQGGNEATRMSFSYSSNRDEGLLVGSGVNRDSYNFKLNHKISDRLKLDLGARITNRVINGAGTGGSSSINVGRIVTKRPTNGIAANIIIDPNSVNDDDLERFLLSQVPPEDIVKQDWRKRSSLSYVLNAGLTWDILDNLKSVTNFSIGKDINESLRFYGPLTGTAQNLGGNPVGKKGDDNDNSYRITNTLIYSFKNLGKHELSVLVGQETASKWGKSADLTVAGFRPSITPKEMFANTQLGDPTLTSQSTSYSKPDNIVSFFGRVNYAYKDKYLFTATLRSDTSSKFSKANQTGYFPAASAAWKISSEPFLKDSKTINELKLRLSYGATGNNRIPNNSTVLLFAASDTKGPGFANNQSSVFYKVNGGTLYNPDLKWETTIGKNIGLDFALFNSVITGNFDIYKNDTKDLLFQTFVPPTSGFSSQWANIGDTSNKGIELGINARLIDKKDFSLSLNANFGANKFTIEKLPDPGYIKAGSGWASSLLRDADDYIAAEGQEVGQIKGYVTDGFYTVDDFASYDENNGYVLKDGIPDDSSIIQTGIKPGNMKLKDLNGDGVITSDDRKIIGKTLPKATGGFGLTGQIKGFDVSAFFNWSYGNDEYNTGKIAYNMFWRDNGSSYTNMLNTMNSANRFTYIDTEGTFGPAGAVITDLTQLGELNQGKTIWSGIQMGRPVITDWAVEDASYIRFSNLTIGYTVPMKKMKKSLISNLRIYVTGTNLYLWTKYSGYDPDANGSRGNDSYQVLAPGVDYSSYPKNRSYTIGANITF